MLPRLLKPIFDRGRAHIKSKFSSGVQTLQTQDGGKRIFIDLGADRGQSLERALSLEFDAYYAFEPHPRSFAKLFEKFGSNPRVHCIQLAAWTEDADDVPLFVRDMLIPVSESDVLRWGEGHSLLREKSNVSKTDFVRVSTVDFSRFIKTEFRASDRITLKMDIEGAEYSVLEKMIREKALLSVQKLFCEWHWNKIGLGANRHWNLINQLRDLGLSVKGINCSDEFLHSSDSYFEQQKGIDPSNRLSPPVLESPPSK